jgi:ABC-2 type transport system permease protein
MKKLLSKNVLRQSVRNNWKLWAIITAILCLFLTIMTSVFPEMQKQAGGMQEFGRGGIGSINDLYASGFFGAMAIMLVMIYAIVTGNKLVASEVDNGTMSFTLNTPITRKQIIFSKLVFYVVSLIAMTALICIAGIISTSIVNADLDLGKFFLLLLGLLLFGFAVSAICFLASCWFNKSGHSLMLGAGVPVAFYILSQLSQITDSLKFLKYFSLNTLYDTSNIIAGTNFAFQFVAMAAIGVILYVIGTVKFLRKDLPL